MKILSFDHVQLAMPAGEEDQARAFYINILGFTEIQKTGELAKRGGAWFQSGDVQLHLGIENEFRPARKAHPAFIVDDLHELMAHVQGAGYETDITQPPLDGYERAHVFDPFGNRIELMERIQKRDDIPSDEKKTMNMPLVRPWADPIAPTQSTLWRLMTNEGLNPYAWSNAPFDIYSPHAHSYNKIIYVVQGSITFGLPELGKKIILKAGDRLDLPADMIHDAQVGAQGVICLEAHKD